jgi:hypothetical protein
MNHKISPRLNNKLCIVTPLYRETLTDAEWLSIRLGEKNLNSYDRFIIAPIRLKNSSIHNMLAQRFNWLWFDDVHYKDITSYNHLLLSYNFYEQFAAYTFMLIYQTDALIFNSNIEYWLDQNYSYIGAPWINNPQERTRTSQLFKGVGNGGFSLRKIPHIIRVLKSSKKLYSFTHYLFNFYEQKGLLNYLKYLYSYLFYIERFNNVKNNKNYNEDKIIACAASRFDFFSVPSPEKALGFAFEENPRLLYMLNKNKFPLGCHAWQKNDPEFYTKLIKDII